MDYEVLDIGSGNVLSHHSTRASAVSWLLDEVTAGGTIDDLNVISWPNGRPRIEVRGAELGTRIEKPDAQSVLYVAFRARLWPSQSPAQIEKETSGGAIRQPIRQGDLRTASL